MSSLAAVAQAQPLDEDQRRLVRGSRYSGKNRLLRRMALGVVKSLEVEDASPTSAALMTLQRWMEKVGGEGSGAHHRQVSALPGAARLRARAGSSVGWASASHARSSWSIECRCCWASSPPRACCPWSSSPRTQWVICSPSILDELEQEAERKGGVLQTLTDHFAKVYKVALLAA